ncbi:SDR family NAD(P)-dependent oxidoreductase [Cupriavidus basilensis]
MTGFDFSGKTVLVTGGARGIGRAIAERFLAAGARVFTCGRTPPESDGMPPREAEFITADIRDAEQVEALLSRIVDSAGSLDIVIHNAGGAPSRSPRTPRRACWNRSSA